MLKEKRDKSKNTDKSENASTKSTGTQNLSGNDSIGSVKEEIPDANKNGKRLFMTKKKFIVISEHLFGIFPCFFIVDATTNIKKEPEDRKSTTPVKNELGSNPTTDKKETMEPVIKSEGILI